MKEHALGRRNVVGNHEAIEVIVLVLHDARRESLELLLHQIPILVVILHPQFHGACDRFTNARDAQTSLVHGIFFLRKIEQDGIDHHTLESTTPGISILSFTKRRPIRHKQAQRQPNLRRRQTHAIRGVHGFPHVVNQGGQIGVVFFHFCRFFFQHGIAVGHNGSNHAAKIDATCAAARPLRTFETHVATQHDSRSH